MKLAQKNILFIQKNKLNKKFREIFIQKFRK